MSEFTASSLWSSCAAARALSALSTLSDARKPRQRQIVYSSRYEADMFCIKSVTSFDFHA